MWCRISSEGIFSTQLNFVFRSDTVCRLNPAMRTWWWRRFLLRKSLTATGQSGREAESPQNDLQRPESL
jgi:hypothetical protein